MSEFRFAATFSYKVRGDTEKKWAELNPVLCAREPALVISEDGKSIAFKIGDGKTSWKDLELHKFADPIAIDNTYNPQSVNAQSGMAVAAAIKNGAENIDYSIPWYAPAATLKDTLDAMASNVLGIDSHAIKDNKLDVLKVPEQASTDYIPTSYAVRATLDATVGDIEAALDSIIAIQNSLIGGAE